MPGFFRVIMNPDGQVCAITSRSDIQSANIQYQNIQIMIRTVTDWVSRFPAYREIFYSLGFHLPRLAMDCIERVRERDVDEKDYAYYLDEVFKEYLRVPGHWSYATRKVCPIELRSSYLDLLVDKIESGKLMLPQHFPLHIVLDPNEIELVSLLHQREYAEKYSQCLSLQRKDETEKFGSQLAGFDSSDSELSTTNVLKLFNCIATGLNLERVVFSKGAKFQILSKMELHIGKIPLYLVWGDPAALKKSGNMHLFFFIGAIDENKRFSLERILPEGGIYRTRNATLADVALCINAHLYFMKIWAS
jgi:hypothetical protein